MSFFKRNENQMVIFNRLWKNRKDKREIKEVELQEIDLKEYLMIDVRSPREFRENHIVGAINVPLPEIKRKIEKQITDKNKKILVCCQSGMRSRKAVEMMEEMNYTQVYNLKGGLENI